MPYAIRGNSVIKKDSGKVVGHSKNPQKYMRTLQAIEHGFVPSKGVKEHSPCRFMKREGSM
jgi:hypothetical protein